MIITEDKIDMLPISDYDKRLLKEITPSLPSNINIVWIDEHTKYSPERTGPYPDYYGMYRIWTGDDYIGVEMDLDTLDSALCLLYDFVTKDD